MKAEDGARSDIEPDGGALETEETAESLPAVDADGHAARAHERCAHHPTRPAIALCDRCREPVCLSCAVPVRGRVLGPGCVAAELGDPALTQLPEPDRVHPGSAVAIAGAVVALIGTAGPWTRTGAADRVLGAWVPDLRWSMLAAASAALLIPATWWLRRRGLRSVATMVLILGVLVSAASALAIAFPPTFQAASWGPWVTAGGGALVGAGALTNVLAELRPTQGI